MNNQRLTRSETDRIISGVCGGLAEYLNTDPVIVRLGFAVLLFASGIGLPIYLILWVIMPVASDLNKPNSEVLQHNIEEMGVTVSSSVNRLGRPGTAGTVLVMLGVYFLLQQFGWLSWISGGVFWPILIIGLGAYFLIRRSQDN